MRKPLSVQTLMKALLAFQHEIPRRMCAFRTSTGMQRMQMCREIMAAPPLSALVICQLRLC